MTDRIHSLNVVLEREIREDDAQPIIEAIKQLKHVIDVKKNVAEIDFYTAREQARYAVMTKVFEALKND